MLGNVLSHSCCIPGDRIVSLLLLHDSKHSVRVIAFSPNVSEKERSKEASKVFFKEIKGINATKDWEALPHEVALGDSLSTSLEKFYLSIPNLTWQPINYPFPSITIQNMQLLKLHNLKNCFLMQLMMMRLILSEILFKQSVIQ